jgi:glycosyltransferase involved in cell wall biosynthesis
MFQRGLLAVAGGRAARVIVHSGHAASLLRQITGSRPRVEVVPHPATVPFAGRLSRDAARGELGIVPGPPLFVLPGVLKAAKLVPEVLSAAAPLLRDGRLRLALVGAVGDDRLAVAARRAGAAVVSAPDGDTYSRWVVASDAVLCLRRESVGEANGPLLDAIGAGRAVLATDTGCIAEVAGDAARLVVGEPSAIGLGLHSLLDAGERAERERVALARAGALTWAASAEVHADLLAELDRA